MFKKAISIGVTAALLGSLMVALVPSVALGSPASVVVTKTADIPRGTCEDGTYIGTASIAITEATPNEWDSDGFTIAFGIRDNAGVPGTVHFSESGMAVGPDSLDPSFSFATIVPDRLFYVTAGSTNTSQIETLTISGLTICADSDAALGDIQFRYYIVDNQGTPWNMGGTFTITATGKLEDQVVAANGAGVPVALIDVVGTFLAGPADVLVGNTETISATTLFTAGNWTLTPVTNWVNTWNGGTTVVQGITNTCNTGGLSWANACTMPTIGTVVDSLWAYTNGPFYIQRGLVNSQPGGAVFLSESGVGSYVGSGVRPTVTLSLDPAIGVKFSGSVQVVAGLPCQPDAARLVLTCTLIGSAGVDSWTIGNPGPFGLSIPLDASLASAAGQEVWVTIGATGYSLVPTKVLIAILNNTADGTADAPTVIIGENDQQSGTITIREAAAGTLGSSAANNVLEACYASHEEFTRAPWLVVTSGDLNLRNPADPGVPAVAAAPGTGVQGMIVPWVMGGFNCAVWIVWSKSTVASTLEIRGSDATGAMLGAGPAHGPQINVPHWLMPGASQLWLGSGSWMSSGTEFRTVVNAIRAYGATPVVAAVSNPEIMRGTPSQAAGDVTITETASAQFGAGEQILFSVVPNNLRDIIPSVRFDTNRDTPVVSTNAASTGLVAHFQGYLNPIQFAIRVDQRAFVPVVGAWVPGVITVSSMKYSTTNDAAYGNVQLEVCSPAIVASTGMISTSFEGFFGQIGLGLCFYKGLYGHDPSIFNNFNGFINVGQEQQPIMGAHPGAWANFDQVATNAHVVSANLFPSMQIAKGYKFRETSPYMTYGTLITQRLKDGKSEYVTNKVYVGAQFQGKAIEFWQRNGKTGTWVKRTTGRVDAHGYAYWSTRPPKLGGTGFDRYVYYRAYFVGTSEVAAAWSQTITRVVVK